MTKEDIERLKIGIANLLDDRDYLYSLVSTIDWDAQLEAIRSVLREHRQSADGVTANIKDLEQEALTYKGPHHDHIVDEHVDAKWRSSYSDAAISLSAIGMVVPMLETIFAQTFSSLGARYQLKGIAPPDHQRWRRAGQHVERWNVQRYFGRAESRIDIVCGLPQLCEATGVSAHLRDGDLDWIIALLSYRNRMFHGGFEWSIPERRRFVALMTERGWEKYFFWSTSSGEPWICYVVDEVIDEFPDRVFAILGSLGRFAKALPIELMSKTGDDVPSRD